MTFAIGQDPQPSEISDALNYLLANFGTGLNTDVNSGEITSGSTVVGYLYKYMDVKYADSSDGSVGFSDSPTNKSYFGTRNHDTNTESTNPADYVWRQATGGFGTTKFLYYQTSGGRQITFAVATVEPTENYLKDTGAAIDLDIITTGKGRQVAYPSIYQWTATSTPPARPTTTTVFTWSTGTYTAPAGWSTTPPTNLTPGAYLWAITVPLSVSTNQTTSVLDWTNVLYLIYNISYNGTNGSTGATGLNGLNFINAYKVQDQANSAPTFTSPTSNNSPPSGWSSTAPAVAVGQVLWYLQGQYNNTNTAISGVPAFSTAWTGPIAASIFQDIRSDNWNGGNPPAASTVSTWGTAGYYISRTDGNMYANGFYARGVVKIDGQVYDTGLGYTVAAQINRSATASVGLNVSGGSSGLSAGIIADSSLISGTGIVVGNSAGGNALTVQNGKMTINNNTLVANLNADLLDGKHATDLVNVAAGTTNGKYYYLVNDTTTPTNTSTIAKWIKLSTNDGSVIWVPGYL
jgi:hypothetical protein